MGSGNYRQLYDGQERSKRLRGNFLRKPRRCGMGTKAEGERERERERERHILLIHFQIIAFHLATFA